MEKNDASFFERTFKLSQNGTNVKTEVMAGITTFMTMAYILIVNPNILSATGMDKGALFVATAGASAFATLCMALFANYPFALAPGMGLNAYFAFVVVLGMGYSWQMALTAVFVEGLIFLVLTFVNIREAIFNAIPLNLKYAVSVGIGLFITFIGMQNAGIIVNDDATLVKLGNVGDIRTLLALVGIVLTGALVYKKVKGALLWGILLTYGLGVFCQLAGLYVVDPAAGMFSLIPSAVVSAPPSIKPILFQFDFASVFTLDFLVVIFAFLFVDLFDTLGTLIGVSSKAGFLDDQGRLPKAKQALFADAIGTTVGAVLGTSTTTTYIESASGVAEGGRTGLTSLVTAILFVVALVFSPVLLIIPAFATAPILIIVGLFMMESVTKIDFADYTEAIPAFLAIVMMPLAYSIAEGIVFGMLAYILMKLLTGRMKEVSPLMLVLGVLFLLRFTV